MNAPSTMMHVFKRLQAAEARIDRTVCLACVLAGCDDLPEEVQFLLYEEDLQRLFGPMPQTLLSELENNDGGIALRQWLLDRGRVGWLLLMSASVNVLRAQGGKLYGYERHVHRWVYGDSFGQAVGAALEWLARERLNGLGQG